MLVNKGGRTYLHEHFMVHSALILQELFDGVVVLMLVVQALKELHLFFREIRLLETNESIISSSLEEKELTQSEHLLNRVLITKGVVI